MKPLRVALVHRDDWHRGPSRIDGHFAYAVPQFEWQHIIVTKRFSLDLHKLRNFDVVWMDDGKFKSDSRFIPDAPHYNYRCPLVAVYALYPTLSAGHYKRRLDRARLNADVVFVDHDGLTRWTDDLAGEAHVRRCAYATNERYYADRGLPRDIDVGFYYVTAFSRERPALDAWLSEYCALRGWTYHTTGGSNVRTEYARLLARTKVVVHMNRTPQTRPARIFDAAASGAAFLGNPLPVVEGEGWQVGVHYLSFDSPVSGPYVPFESKDVPTYTDADCEELAMRLDQLLEGGMWRWVAANAQQRVLACHTWARRAEQLYVSLLDLFPKLREGRETWMYR